MAFLLSFYFLMWQGQVTTTPQAYHVSDQARAAPSDEVFYYNDLEHYRELSNPWVGYNFTAWTIVQVETAHTGDQIFIGSSQSNNEEAYVISELFNTQGTDFLSIRMQARFWTGINTWQLVPQGPELIMARFIVNPDGSVSVVDADSVDFEPTPTAARVKLFYLDGSWEDVEFKLNRRQNRYTIFLNGERIHSGTPFTTQIDSIVLVQTMRTTSVRMHLDTIEVRPDLAGVPTLSTWSLIAFCIALGLVAILYQRRRIRSGVKTEALTDAVRL